MKTVNKKIPVIGFAAIFAVALSGTGVRAEPAAGFQPAAAAAPATLPVPAMPASLTGNDDSGKAEADISKTMNGAEDRAAKEARDVVKQLDSDSDTTTLQDINTARQAVARLQAMIAVEKELADFEKIRNDRAGGSHNFAAAIPASALAPAAGQFAQSAPAAKPQGAAQPVVHASSGATLERITGVDGNYVAAIKIAGDTKTARLGDRIAGLGTVRAISPSSVQLEDGGSMRSLHIKNIDAIYSAMN